MEIKGRKFGIIGMARSGLAAAKKILDNGGSVFISEFSADMERLRETVCRYYDVEFWNKVLPMAEFGRHSEAILDCDLVIVSPGVPTESPIVKKCQEFGLPVISEIEFGYLLKEPKSKIIAVTGSNGKSTTVSIISHLLKTAGYKTILAGNIGLPFTSFPIEKEGIDFIVLEVSSFQLELVEKFHPDTAVLLNITPDHLDRHGNIETYISKKMNIFINQNENDVAIINAEDEIVTGLCDKINAKIKYYGVARNSKAISAYLTDKNHICVDDRVIDISKIQLFGIHNRSNILAAVSAIADYIKSDRIIKKGLASFKPLPNRLETVAVLKGITFVNDSKATNGDSVKYALSAFDNRPIHIILGGYDKGEDFSHLVPFLKKYVKSIHLIGATKKIMLNTFSDLKNIITTYETLEDAVKMAYKKGSNNEIVLLSPACASYDMFRDYEHRGEIFRYIVQELTNA